MDTFRGLDSLYTPNLHTEQFFSSDMISPTIHVYFDSTFTGENPIVFSLPKDSNVQSWNTINVKEYICSKFNSMFKTNDIELQLFPSSKLGRNRFKLIQEHKVHQTEHQSSENNNNNNNVNDETCKTQKQELALFVRSDIDQYVILKEEQFDNSIQMEIPKCNEYEIMEKKDSPSKLDTFRSRKRMKLSSTLPTSQAPCDTNLPGIYMKNFNRYKNSSPKDPMAAQMQATRFAHLILWDNEQPLLSVIKDACKMSFILSMAESTPFNFEKEADRQPSSTQEYNVGTTSANMDVDRPFNSTIDGSQVQQPISQSDFSEDIVIFATLKQDKVLLIEFEIECPVAPGVDTMQFPIAVSQDPTFHDIKSKIEAVTGVQEERLELFLLSGLNEVWVDWDDSVPFSAVPLYHRLRLGSPPCPNPTPWLIVRDFAPWVNLLVEFCNNNLTSQDDSSTNNASEGTTCVRFMISVPKRRTIRDIKKMIMKEPKVLETLTPKQCEIILYQLNEENRSIKEALTVRYQQLVLHDVTTPIQCNMRLANSELYKISACVAQQGEVLRVYKCHNDCHTLLDHCVHFLVDIMNDANIPICKELAQLPVEIKQKILMRLAKKGMNPLIYHEALKHLFEKGMTWLSLEGYGFGSEDLLALVPHCSNLKYVNLNYCKDVAESVLISLAQSVPYLESLSLAHTMTSKQVILEFMQHCKNLKHLNVQRCSGVTASSIADFIPYISNLQELNISHNPSLATEQLKDLLAVTACLESLIMDGYYLVNANIFEQLFYHPSIKSLRLRNCQPPPDLVSIFKQTNSKLETLDLAGSNLNELTFLLISHRFPALSKLNLFGCQNLTDVVLEHISVVYSTLKEIRLGMCNITHNSLKTLTAYCQQITTLDLRLCRHIKSFVSIAQLKQLKDLNLSGTSVSDHDLQLITAGCSNLSALYLVECHQISHTAPAMITDNSKSLRHLDLAGSVSVVDPIDQVLKVTYNLSLEYLNLEHLEISESSIPQIVSKFPRLKELYVYSWTSSPKIGHLHLVDIH